ncbi:hypothetical protein LBMAG27_15760 [Bacteroidota bacterium]|nr:hypothetical protein LBMAG27_15760 [Bacteroidota bacterium]
MKNQLLILFALFALVVSAFSSCKKPITESNPNFSLTELLTSGPWEISFFFDGTTDRSTEFNRFTFTFLSNGIMYAANSSETISGAWANENSATQLNISISGNSQLTYLNKNWIISSTANSTIIMQDGNSGNISELHFVKK